MKTSGWIFLLTSLFFLFTGGCQASRTPDYFPLKAGLSWEYQFEPGGQFILSISSAEKQKNREYFLADMSAKGGEPGSQRDEYFLNREGIFLARRTMLPALDITFNPPQKILGANPKPGATWKWSGEILTNGPGGSKKQRGDFLMEAVCFESIKAMKRNYRCLRVRLTGTISPDIRVEETRWYCDGIGLIKNEAALVIEGRRQLTNAILATFHLK